MFVTVFKFAGVSENAMNFVSCALLMDFYLNLKNFIIFSREACNNNFQIIAWT